MGFNGNIGSRQKFTWNDKTFYLLEAQRCVDCWDQWKIILCDSKLMPITELPIQTPSGKSKSFANPNILQMANGSYIVSLFMPTEGNQFQEAGNLIFQIEMPSPQQNFATRERIKQYEYLYADIEDDDDDDLEQEDQEIEFKQEGQNKETQSTNLKNLGK